MIGGKEHEPPSLFLSYPAPVINSEHGRSRRFKNESARHVPDQIHDLIRLTIAICRAGHVVFRKLTF
jgi:hypothetical protein